MKTFTLLLFLALVAQQRQSPQQPAPLDADHCRCSIEVTVKRAVTGEPIPNIELQLRAADTRTPSPDVPIYLQLQGTLLTVKTAASGRAEFRNLAEGSYTIVVRRQGDFFFEEPSSSVAQVSVYVGPREKPIQQLAFTMLTGGTVNGRILDSNRQPVRTAINAYQVEFQNGQRTLVASSTGEETNELGEYQLTHLHAGEYYIRTVSSLPQQNQTYYPGVFGPRSAVPVTVQEGQELSGIDFSIPANMGVTISGIIINTLSGSDTQPNGKLLHTLSSLYLVPRNTGLYFDFPQEIPNAAKQGGTGNGTEFPFEIQNVPPGSYDLYPLFLDTTIDTHVERHMSPTHIDVGTEDIRNIKPVIRKGTALTIRASRDGSASPPTTPFPEASMLGVNLIPKDSQPSQSFSGRNGFDISLKPSSWPSISELMEGGYFVSVRLSGFLPSDYVSDIRQGTRSVFDDGFVALSSDTTDSLEVIIRSGGGTIQGRINTNGQARRPSPVTVTLVPDPPRRQNLSLYKNATISPEGNGNFSFTGLAPGTYRVFAWENLPSGAEQNAEFMSEYETRGISVTISAGLNLTNIDIPLIHVH